MRKNESITHIMTTDIVSVNLSAKPSEVHKMMSEACVHHVPIVDKKKPIGMVSAVDLLRVSFSSIYVDANANDNSLDYTVSLKEIMTSDVVTIKSNDSIRHAAEMLATSNYNSLLVINSQGELVGIVTSKDLINYLLKQY